MSTANDLTQAAKQDFLDRNRDLLALTKNGANDVFKRIAAALALDQRLQDDVMTYADHLDQPNAYARGVSRADFKREMYTAICKAFLKIQHNYVVEFISKLTPEATAQLEDIEIIGGLRTPRAVVPPPPPPLSAAEQLEAQVIADFRGGLSTDKMRVKMNTNVAYRETFNRLSDSGKLESQITTLHDGREI
jgi:hypothetical protein